MFNAALVIVAYLLACKSGTIAAGIMPTTTEVAMDTLKMATSALKILDRGNIMIERCWHYLEQLSSVVEDIGKSFQFLSNFLPNFADPYVKC